MMRSASMRFPALAAAGRGAWLSLGLAVLICGCRGEREAKYPAPVYETPELPAWEAPSADTADPLTSLDELGGEWVVDEEPDGEDDAEDDSGEGSRVDPDDPPAPVDPSGKEGQFDSQDPTMPDKQGDSESQKPVDRLPGHFDGDGKELGESSSTP